MCKRPIFFVTCYGNGLDYTQILAVSIKKVVISAFLIRLGAVHIKQCYVQQIKE